MSYQQLVTPNLDPYIYVNGAPLNDWCGWCMGYVSSAFQIFGAASAHIGWTKSQLPHTDKNFPAGVYIPIWFDWYGDIDGTGVKNWGHVAIYKDGQVWSSPITHKPYADSYGSLDALVAAFGNTIKYVGWSEDLLGTKLIESQGDNMITNDDVASVRIIMSEVEGWNGDEIHSGKDDAQIMSAWAGQTFPVMLMHCWTVQTKHRQDLIRDMDGLTSKVDELGKAVAIKDGAIKDLQSQLATVGADTTNLNSVGVALQWLIKRLGLTK